MPADPATDAVHRWGAGAGRGHKTPVELPRGAPLRAGRRWAIERTDSRRPRGLRVHAGVRTRVIEAFTAPAGTIITIRNLIHRAWTTRR